MSAAGVTADRLDYQRGVQSKPLTDQEIEQINRLLSDPTQFPRDFKRWVTDHAGDTVDIAKSQVHGLVNSTGQVVSGPAELYYAPYIGSYGLTSGHEDNIVVANDVECNGGPVDVTFFVPICVHYDVLFGLYLEGVFQGMIGRFTHVGSGGVMAATPVNLTVRLKPVAGRRDFKITARSVGSGTTIIAGGVIVASESFAPGFFRISKA